MEERGRCDQVNRAGLGMSRFKERQIAKSQVLGTNVIVDVRFGLCEGPVRGGPREQRAEPYRAPSFHLHFGHVMTPMPLSCSC
jgi:hypothetical protein